MDNFLLTKVISNLNGNDLRSVKLVSKRFYAIVNSNPELRAICYRQFSQCLLNNDIEAGKIMIMNMNNAHEWNGCKIMREIVNSGDNVKFVEYVHANGLSLGPNCGILAAAHGCVNILKFLTSKGLFEISPNLYYYAARAESTDCIAFAHDQNIPFDVNDILNRLRHSSGFDISVKCMAYIIAKLRKYINQEQYNELITYAIERRNLQCLRLLCEKNGNTLAKSRANDIAICHSNIECTTYLISIGYVIDKHNAIEMFRRSCDLSDFYFSVYNDPSCVEFNNFYDFIDAIIPIYETNAKTCVVNEINVYFIK